MDRDLKIIWGIVGVIVVLTVVGIVWVIRATDEWNAQCEARGGHVLTDTDTNVGIGTNGKPVVVSDSTSFCLTEDGRILDIR